MNKSQKQKARSKEPKASLPKSSKAKASKGSASKGRSKNASKGERYKVNFSNAKVRNVISHLEICEGRLSKDTFMKASNKDVYYQMLHSGYIKQNGNMVIATTKLRNHISSTNGTHISSSCSIEHSRNVEGVLSFLPKSVLSRRAYQTQSDLEIRYKRDFKNDASYRERLNELKSHYSSKLESLQQAHSSYSPSSDAERMKELVHFKKEKEHLQSRMEILETSPSLVCDFSVRLTRDEIDVFIDNLSSHREELTNQNEISHYTQSIDTLSTLRDSMDSSHMEEVEIGIEILTNHYMQREIFKHQNYAYITNKPLIML